MLSAGVAFFLFAPFLVTGFLIPFYVGYIRGAIVNPTFLLERARGWVYFVISTLAYLGTIQVVIIRVFYPAGNIPSVIEWASLVIYILCILLFILSFRRIVSFFDTTK
jgi:hypothetical protein